MTDVKTAARKAQDSPSNDRLARSGLVSRGAVWLVVGLLAVRLALGGGGKADRQGALTAIREQPFGKAVLLLIAAGFAAHAVYRALEAAVGHRDADDDQKRLLKRVASAARAVLYASFAVTTLTFLAGSGNGGGSNAKGPTAKALALPGGQVLVKVAGLVIIGVGVIFVVRAFKGDFEDKLRPVPGTWGRCVKALSKAGPSGRGVVYALVGGFLVQAAVTFDAAKAKGLDAALKTLAAQPYGDVLLLVTALGMLAFALWSFCEAAYKKL